MASNQAKEAKRALVAVLNAIYKYGQLQYNAYFKIYNTKIAPIIFFGSEFWGTRSRQLCEQVLSYACKGIFVFRARFLTRLSWETAQDIRYELCLLSAVLNAC